MEKPELCRGFYIPWTCGMCPQKARCKPKPAPSQNEPKRKARA